MLDRGDDISWIFIEEVVRPKISFRCLVDPAIAIAAQAGPNPPTMAAPTQPGGAVNIIFFDECTLPELACAAPRSCVKGEARIHSKTRA